MRDIVLTRSLNHACTHTLQQAVRAQKRMRTHSITPAHTLATTNRRSVHDKQNMRDVVLTDEELAIIQRIQGGKFPESNFDPYEGRPSGKK